MKKRINSVNSPRRKTTSRKRHSAKVKQQLYRYILTGIFVTALLLTVFHYRVGLAYYLGFKSDKVIPSSSDSKQFSDIRNYQLLSKYDDKVVGIDVSQYQGTIIWSKVKKVENAFPIRFVFIRATAGSDRLDSQFYNNWPQSKNNGLIRGAYHYYRPNENSIKQALFYIKHVRLAKSDLPPVLDIEALPKYQSIDSLKVGLKRWLSIVDVHYKMKPIIYTNEKFYEDFLKEDFGEYRFWIANYNFFSEQLKDDWLFWQFTEKASIDGIDGNVDVNIFNGTMKMLLADTKL